MQTYITEAEYKDLYKILMGELTGRTCPAEWKIEDCPVTLEGTATSDCVCCGPVAIIAMETIISRGLGTTEALFTCDPRGEAIFALRNAIVNLHATKGLISCDDITPQSIRKTLDLCKMEREAFLKEVGGFRCNDDRDDDEDSDGGDGKDSDDGDGDDGDSEESSDGDGDNDDDESNDEDANLPGGDASQQTTSGKRESSDMVLGECNGDNDMQEYSTLWTYMPQAEIETPLDPTNERHENEIEKSYEDATVPNVEDPAYRNKQVRYTCPLCVYAGKGKEAFSSHFSLDLFRDPADTTYNPAKDPRLERGKKMYFISYKFAIPVPWGKMRSKADESARVNARQKRSKFRAHVRKAHPDLDLGVLTLSRDYISIEEEKLETMCRETGDDYFSKRENPIANRKLRRMYATKKSEQKKTRFKEAKKRLNEKKKLSMRRLREERKNEMNSTVRKNEKNVDDDGGDNNADERRIDEISGADSNINTI